MKMSAVFVPLFNVLFLLCFSALSSAAAADQLQGKRTEMGQKDGKAKDSFVCVCNATHCDALGEDEVPLGTLLTYVSDRKWKRLEKRELSLGGETAAPNEDGAPSVDIFRINVNPSEKYQTIFGFGGAFSDSFGTNLKALSAPVRRHLLEAYFHSEKGIRYSIGRVPVGSTDFSTRQYSYVDTENDFALSTFSLAPEDFEDKIPFIKEAARLSGHKLRLIGCPWTAPAWMKTNGKMIGGGQLKGEVDGIFYRAYAKYLLRFLEEYAKNDVHFWALSIQNQPQEVPDDFPFQSMFMSNHTQREFAARILSPLLKQSPLTDQLKLLVFDDVREFFLSSMEEIFGSSRDSSDNEMTVWCRICRGLGPILPEFVSASVEQLFHCNESPTNEGRPSGTEVIDGIGVHWYTLDAHAEQDQFHEQHPDKIILSTEACTGFIQPEEAGPRLGNWTRGWQYGRDIVQNLRHWTGGWVDWNMAVDMKGGPSWMFNHVDAPIVVNAERDEFYKQPMFYFLAHFSRFIPPGSVRIRSTLFDSDGDEIGNGTDHSVIQHVSAITPNGQKVLVMINSGADAVKIRIDEVGSDRMGGAMVELGEDSILTAIWK